MRAFTDADAVCAGLFAGFPAANGPALGVAGMMDFELIALGPLAPLAMLVSDRP